MPLSGALRHFFTFICCAMSTAYFVRECPLPREDFLSLSYVLCIHATPTSKLSRAAEDDWQATIFISQVTRRQSDQADVGFGVWPSAIVLLRWLVSNSQGRDAAWCELLPRF